MKTSPKSPVFTLMTVVLLVLIALLGCEKRDPSSPSDDAINPVDYVAKLMISASPSYVEIDTVGAAGTCDIYVVAKTAEDVVVRNVPIVLSTSLGFIQDVVYTDSTGSAITQLNNAGAQGKATVRARIIKDVNTVLQTAETEVEFKVTTEINPENEILRLSADPQIIYADDGETISKIAILLTNLDGEPIPDRDIIFSAVNSATNQAIGSIPQMALTNESGRDTVIFNDGGDVGEAMIIGRAGNQVGAVKDTVLVEILSVPSDSVANVILNVDDFDIQVRGTGGDETARYTAWLYDENNNLVPDGREVTFRIMYAPDTLVYLNNPGQTEVMAITTGGKATALIYSGIKSGTIQVSASAGLVTALNTKVVVGSGPPAMINVFYQSEGDQIGGGIWQIGIGAIVDDTYGNAVAHGTAVHFWIDPPEHPSEIYPFSYTGIGNAEGDSTEGVAFTHLNYGPSEMFTPIVIWAASDTVQGSSLVTLPFQDIEEGAILLTVIPTVVVLNGGTGQAIVTATLVDGYGHPVPGGTIIFENQVAGQFLINPVETDTGGIAQTIIRFTQNDFPGEVEQVTAIVRARLGGYNLVSDDIDITVFK